MCDQDDFDTFRQAGKPMTRRAFGRMTLGAGLAAVLPRPTLADVPVATGPMAATRGRDVEIETPDGTADAFFVTPADGRHPGVLMWPDIFGLRPAFREMATRLAASGYAVLVVNPFYRTARAPTAPEHADFGDPKTREHLLALMRTLDEGTTRVDSAAFVAFLDRQPGVDTGRGIGTAGYCMGGPLVLRTAAFRHDRVRAVASFHGGGLVTGRPDSPHLLIPKMRAQFLIAIAESDDIRDPAVKNVLREDFEMAQLDAEIKVYAGTHHGWCPTDSRVYDRAQAEKAWGRMLDRFGRAL